MAMGLWRWDLQHGAVSGPGGTDIAVLPRGVVVSPGPLAAVEVNPDRINARVQDTIPLSVTAVDEFGNEIREVVFTWTAQDSAGGTIGQQGLFTAGTQAGFFAGGVKVTATQGDTTREAALDVSVSPGPFSSLVVSPPEVTLNIGDTRSFTLRIYDEFENEIFDALTSWGIAPSVGVVDANGVLTAGTRAGAFPEAVRVEAVKGTERATVTAEVSIMPDPLARPSRCSPSPP